MLDLGNLGGLFAGGVSSTPFVLAFLVLAFRWVWGGWGGSN